MKAYSHTVAPLTGPPEPAEDRVTQAVAPDGPMTMEAAMLPIATAWMLLDVWR